VPKSPDRERARYLLASDLIQQQQGEKALKAMDSLEQNYPVLAANIALKRAQAYDRGQSKAQAARHDLLKRYPDHPVAAEALFVLGRNQPKYWKQAIAQFPAHPALWSFAPGDKIQSATRVWELHAQLALRLLLAH